MKKLFVLFVLSFACFGTFNAQTNGFAPLGAEWYFDVFDPWSSQPEYTLFYVNGDTTIQGRHCNVIQQSYYGMWNCNWGIGHEDGDFVYQENNKVYWFNPITDAFTILYDFDAEVGDTWFCDVDSCSYLVTVMSVDSVNWQGRTYRTQRVRSFENNIEAFNGRIIEGIGYEKGLFPNDMACHGEIVFDIGEIDYLRCYSEDGDILYHEGDYGCDQTYSNFIGSEWYYEIINPNGDVTYQYLQCVGDTTVGGERPKIIVRTNTIYDDKNRQQEVTHEYVYERYGKVYWWNKELQQYTILYDLTADEGDEWEIKVGTESLIMHVDAIEDFVYEGKTYRKLIVSDANNVFSGDIVVGFGHTTSFFPEKLMNTDADFLVDGLRCYWENNVLVYQNGDEDCDAVYYEYHDVDENPVATFAVYPNPTDGLLFVEGQGEYRITNPLGQILLLGTTTKTIDVSSLPAGLYFLTIGDQTQKIIINRIP